MIKKLLLVIGAFALGFFGNLAYSGALPQFFQRISNLTQPITSSPIVTQIQTTWSSLPNTYKTVTFTAIPTIFMVFFAWTKQRAMQKLQETQMQAAQQVSSLNSQMQALVSERDQKIQQLQSELQLAKSNPDLLASLQEAQNLVSQKQKEINDLKLFYQGQIQILQDKITDLEERLRVKPLVK